MAEDRRKYPRFDICAKIRFKQAEEKSFSSNGSAKNISAEGFCFTCSEKLAPKTILDVEIVEKGLESSPLKVRAEVVWCYKSGRQDSQGAELYDVGLKVLDVRSSDEARFTILYCDRMLAEIKSYLRI